MPQDRDKVMTTLRVRDIEVGVHSGDSVYVEVDGVRQTPRKPEAVMFAVYLQTAVEEVTPF